jgi:hypothetical protein
MKKSIPFRPKVTLALLLSMIVLNVVTVFMLFPRIETLVHGDLYGYGLQFSLAWANRVWNNSYLFLICLKIAIVIMIPSAMLVIAYARKHDAISKVASILMITAGAVITIFSLYPFYWLNRVVNGELYFFGLKFSEQWYSNYSLYIMQSVFFVLLASGFAVAAALLISLSARKTANLAAERWSDSILIISGITFLALSIAYTSSILVLIGLGLLFWGLILTYISNKEYVKKILLETSTSSQLSTVNKVIQETDCAGNAIFFPPRYFKIPETYKAYIPKDKNSKLPTPRIIYREDPRFFIKSIENPPAVLITPPGAELVTLFEKTLKKKFSEMNLQYLMVNLPKLLVEDLEMVQYFEMNMENEMIHVRIDGSVYVNTNVDEQEPIYFSFSSPLTGAIGCALASVLNKPIMILKQRTDPLDEATVIEYRMMSDEGEAITT